jgi:hypothetical protein
MSSCERASRLPCESSSGLARTAAALLAAGLATFALACAMPPAPPLIRHEGPLGIEVESPRPGSTLALRALRVPVRGRARLPSDFAIELLDVFVLVDVSEATRHPSGFDVDGDGEVGFDPHRVLVDLEPGGLLCTDPEDSIRHAEVAAVHRLLDHLDEATDQLGLAFFSGAATAKSDGTATLPLGSRFEDVRSALEGALAEEQPARSLGEAVGTAQEALQAGRSSARRILLLLQASPEGRREWSLPDGIEAASYAVSGVGRSSRGLRPLRRPVDVLAWLAPPSRSGDASLAIANASLGSQAGDAFLARDGRFSGWIGVQAGSNRLRVSARDGQGKAGMAEFAIDVQQELPSHWELLQELEETQRRNQALIRLIEEVEERKPGEIEIRLER